MAVDLSIARPSFTPSIPSIQKPSKHKTFLGFNKTSNFTPLVLKSSIGFPIPTATLRSFKCSATTEPEVSESKLESNVGVKYPSDMKTLIESYKKVILSGDENTVSEIEAMIYGLENEKNELDEKIGALAEDVASQKEKFIYMQADFDNFRKRFDKDKLRLTSKTQKELLASLLPIVDKFEGVKQQIKPETEMGEKINTSYQGIYKQFVETLRSLHVSVVETVGKPFDPLRHEAIAREESQGLKDGFIIREVRRGFILGDQVLRPAGVIVSMGPGDKKAPSTKESEGRPTAAGLDGDSVSDV